MAGAIFSLLVLLLWVGIGLMFLAAHYMPHTSEDE